jgi:hypothetical protein
MRELAEARHGDYISLLALECSQAACPEKWPEVFDHEHCNELGSKIIAGKVRGKGMEPDPPALSRRRFN